MAFTFYFLNHLFWGIYLTLPPLTCLLVVIAILGLVVGRVEKWSRFDAIYWAFVTALTVGYGDFRPIEKISKVLSLLIALIGVMVFGIIVAITVSTFTVAFEKYVEIPS